MSTETTRRPGRPRSQQAHAAVLRATVALLETTTIRDLTIEGIARAAGVGKPTIYRWWPSKNALVIEAAFARLAEQVAFPRARTTEAALVAQVRTVATLLAGLPGRRLAELLGEAQSDPDTLRELNERFMSIRRDAARALIRQGQERGEIDPDVDPDVAIELIYGPLYFRLLFGFAPVTPAFAEAVVRQALRGLSPGRPS